MKILHFADIHLDDTNIDQVKPALQFLGQTVQEIKPDLILVPGDLVTRGKITPLQSMVLRTFFTKCANIAPIHLILGNHDIGSSISPDFVHGIMGIYGKNKQLEPPNNMEIYIKPSLKHLGDIDIGYLPYPSKHILFNELKSISYEVISEKLRTILSNFSHQRQTHPKIPLIVLFHGMVVGGSGDKDKILMPENEFVLNSSDFKADYVIAGHLHKHQVVGNVVYSGSIAPLTFAQTGFQPYCLLWEIKGSNINFEKIAIPIQHNLYSITIEETEENINNYIESKLSELTIKDSSIRIKFNLPKETMDQIDSDKLNRLLADTYQQKISCNYLRPLSIRIKGLEKVATVFQALEKYIKYLDISEIDGQKVMAVSELIEEKITETETVSHSYIPLSISWRNFKQLKEGSIDFTQSGSLICICGKNKVGKSNFADIEGFTLWKKTSKGSKIDNIIRKGQKECVTEDVFQSNNSIFKATRLFKLNPSGTVKTEFILERKIDDTDKWEIINPKNQVDAQNELEEKIGSYEFYRSSRFASQHDIARLINLKPAELKELFLNTIGVEKYLLRHEIAKSVGKNISDKIVGLENNLPLIREEIEKRNIKTKDIGKEQETLKDARIEREKTAEKLSELTKIIEETKILLEKTRIQIRELNDINVGLEELNMEEEQLQSILEYSQKELQTNKTRYYELEKTLGALTAKQDVLDATKENITDTEKQLLQLKLEREELKKILALSGDEILLKKGRVRELSILMPTIIAAERELVNIKEEHARNQEKLKLLEGLPCKDTEYMEKCELISDTLKSKNRQKALKLREKILKEQIRDAEKLKIEFDKLRREGNWDDLYNQFTRAESTQKKNQEQILALEGKLKDFNVTRLSLEEDLKEVLQLTTEFTKLGEKDWNKLYDHFTRAESTQKRITEERKKLKNRKEKLSDIGNVSNLTRQIDTSTEQKNQLDREGSQLEQKEKELLKEIATHEEHQKELESWKQKEQEVVQKLSGLKEKQNIVNVYLKAMSRDGIPYFLVEQALPSFESYVNEFLENDLCPLRIYVDSLKTLKKGEQRDEITITFEDEDGISPLSELSGFQCNALAIAERAALAKVQADYQGSQIFQYTLDEGFSPFDKENLDIARQLLKRLSNSFERFVYITHLSELEGAADTVYRIVGSKDGSIVE